MAPLIRHDRVERSGSPGSVGSMLFSRASLLYALNGIYGMQG